MPLQIFQCDGCETHTAQVVCLQCSEYFCTRCDEKRHDTKNAKKHKRYPVAEIEEGLPSRLCQVQGHEELYLSAFCQTCSKLICANCIIEDHKLHTYLNLKTVMETIKINFNEEIKFLAKDIQMITEEIKIKEKQLERQKEKLEKNTGTC